MNWLKQILRRASAVAAAFVIGIAAPGLANPVEPADTATPEARGKLAQTIEQPPAAAVAHPRPALWKVSDADTTVYIFGTVHALPKKVEWMDDIIANALTASDELVTEVDLGTMDKLGPAIASMATLPEDENLRDMLNADDRAAYETAMKQVGLPIGSFDRLEPWYAALMLSTLPLIRDGYTPDTGVETVLASHFAAERPRGALETIEYQLGLFDSLPLETQLSYLREVAKGVPDMKEKLDEMIARWLDGDAVSLAKLINDEDSDPLLLDRLLTQRNRKWAQWIGERLDRPGTVFMAVGAGHLAGNESVQVELARQGIAVFRVQ